MSGFRLIVVECAELYGESQRDTIVQTIREVLGGHGTRVSVIEEPAAPSPPEPNQKPAARPQRVPRPEPADVRPPLVRARIPRDDDEAEDNGPVLSHTARVMAALRRDENLNLPELARQCYGESTKDMIQKVRFILYGLVNQRRIKKISLNRYRIIED